MKHLRLEVKNTDEQILEYQTEQKRLTIHCRNCRKTYKATIREQMDNPECRHCGK